jgi:hypothetical protein
MISPSVGNKRIPPNQVGPPPFFAQEFNAPIVQETVFIQIGYRYRIWINASRKIPLKHDIDEFCGASDISASPFAFRKHIVYFRQPDGRVMIRY